MMGGKARWRSIGRANTKVSGLVAFTKNRVFPVVPPTSKEDAKPTKEVLTGWHSWGWRSLRCILFVVVNVIYLEYVYEHFSHQSILGSTKVQEYHLQSFCNITEVEPRHFETTIDMIEYKDIFKEGMYIQMIGKYRFSTNQTQKTTNHAYTQKNHAYYMFTNVYKSLRPRLVRLLSGGSIYPIAIQLILDMRGDDCNQDDTTMGSLLWAALQHVERADRGYVYTWAPDEKKSLAEMAATSEDCTSHFVIDNLRYHDLDVCDPGSEKKMNAGKYDYENCEGEPALEVESDHSFLEAWLVLLSIIIVFSVAYGLVLFHQNITEWISQSIEENWHHSFPHLTARQMKKPVVRFSFINIPFVLDDAMGTDPNLGWSTTSSKKKHKCHALILNLSDTLFSVIGFFLFRELLSIPFIFFALFTGCDPCIDMMCDATDERITHFFTNVGYITLNVDLYTSSLMYILHILTYQPNKVRKKDIKSWFRRLLLVPNVLNVICTLGLIFLSISYYFCVVLLTLVSATLDPITAAAIFIGIATVALYAYYVMTTLAKMKAKLKAIDPNVSGISISDISDKLEQAGIPLEEIESQVLGMAEGDANLKSLLNPGDLEQIKARVKQVEEVARSNKFLDDIYDKGDKLLAASKTASLQDLTRVNLSSIAYATKASVLEGIEEAKDSVMDMELDDIADLLADSGMPVGSIEVELESLVRLTGVSTDTAGTIASAVKDGAKEAVGTIASAVKDEAKEANILGTASNNLLVLKPLPSKAANRASESEILQKLISQLQPQIQGLLVEAQCHALTRLGLDNEELDEFKAIDYYSLRKKVSPAVSQLEALGRIKLDSVSSVALKRCMFEMASQSLPGLVAFAMRDMGVATDKIKSWVTISRQAGPSQLREEEVKALQKVGATERDIDTWSEVPPPVDSRLTNGGAAKTWSFDSLKPESSMRQALFASTEKHSLMKEMKLSKEQKNSIQACLDLALDPSSALAQSVKKAQLAALREVGLSKEQLQSVRKEINAGKERAKEAEKEMLRFGLRLFEVPEDVIEEVEEAREFASKAQVKALKEIGLSDTQIKSFQSINQELVKKSKATIMAQIEALKRGDVEAVMSIIKAQLQNSLVQKQLEGLKSQGLKYLGIEDFKQDIRTRSKEDFLKKIGLNPSQYLVATIGGVILIAAVVSFLIMGTLVFEIRNSSFTSIFVGPLAAIRTARSQITSKQKAIEKHTKELENGDLSSIKVMVDDVKTVGQTEVGQTEVAIKEE